MKSTSSSLYSSRVVVFVHRTLGLVLLFPIIFVAATGALLGVGEHLERILEPRLYSVQASSRERLDQEQIAAKLVEYGETLVLEPYAGSFDTYRASYIAADGEERQLWIDPFDGKVLADRSRAVRLSSRLRLWHSFAYSPLAGLVALLTILVVVCGLMLFRVKYKARHFWHSYIMLAAAPFTFWLATSGLFISLGVDGGLMAKLHNPPFLAPRLLLVVAMLTVIAGAVLAVYSSKGAKT